MSMLKVENLSVHYGMIQAVRDVSFVVNEGEVVSLIGANGAGKTSILPFFQTWETGEDFLQVSLIFFSIFHQESSHLQVFHNS